MHQVDWRTGSSSKWILVQGHCIGLLFSLEKDIINPSRTLNESVCAHFAPAVGQSESAARLPAVTNMLQLQTETHSRCMKLNLRTEMTVST